MKVGKTGVYFHANEVQMKRNIDKYRVYLQVNEVQIKTKFNKKSEKLQNSETPIIVDQGLPSDLSDQSVIAGL